MVILQVLLFLNEKKNKKALENFENEILIKSNNEMKFNISGLSRNSKIR